MYNNTFDLKAVNRMLDISAVKTDVTLDEVQSMIDLVKKYQCICASPMPWITKYTVDQLQLYPKIIVTGVIGFPSGAETSFTKIAAVKDMISVGCKEIDMVSNVSALKSGAYDIFYNDLKEVVDTAGDIPVKAILEICYLSDDEIKKASELAVRAGAAYIKTGTGWGTKPTTIETIKLIKTVTGNETKIKAAGGIRTIDDIISMAQAGCDRFGIGVRSGKKILSAIYDDHS